MSRRGRPEGSQTPQEGVTAQVQFVAPGPVAHRYLKSAMPMQIIKEKMARYILTPSQINGALMAMERGGNL